MPETQECSAHVAAHAKINLDLRVLAREESGFHQIETLFQRISLADQILIRVRPGAGIALSCDVDVGVPSEQNLAWRAAAAYRHATGWPADNRIIEIAITKRIPSGAGLGGGSADAGAVFRGLNALNPVPLVSDKLLDVAATLGADVPFLTSEVPFALAWGRGERMLSLPPLPQRLVHLAQFRHGVNTAVAYRELAAARAEGRVTAAGSAMRDADRVRSWAEVQRHSRNDFEIPIFALRPDIAAVHAAMSAAAPGAFVRMTGSGATIVAITDEHTSELTDAARRWAGAFEVVLDHAATLEQLPTVAILSAPANPR